jgi:metal-responsive CopG/Arc/MetJ family transcriptional regulator
MRVKTSVTLPSTLLLAIDKVEDNRSAFLEKAAIAYLMALDRRRREDRDLEIINRNAKRLNKETEDVLGYQRWP